MHRSQWLKWIAAGVVLPSTAFLLPPRSLVLEAKAMPKASQSAEVRPVVRAQANPAPAARRPVVRAEVAQERPQNPVQGEKGKLSGIIYDQTNARIPGVMVTVNGPGGVAVQSATSRSTGEYEISGVRPGEYTLVTRLPGFSTLSRTVALQSGENRQDFILQVRGIESRVEVSGARRSAAPGVVGGPAPGIPATEPAPPPPPPHRHL